MTDEITDTELRHGELNRSRLKWSEAQRAIDFIVRAALPVVVKAGFREATTGTGIAVGSGKRFVGHLRYDGTPGMDRRHMYTLLDQQDEEAAIVTIVEDDVRSVSIALHDGWSFYYIGIAFDSGWLGFGDPHHVQ